jgi:hypothetical protein
VLPPAQLSTDFRFSIEVTHQIYGHLVPSSFDRARTALDNACHKSRRREAD